tara:strand:+ start:1565 stop:2215 length:651 start_codon:yes stop_codon:yes gene_type:complete
MKSHDLFLDYVMPHVPGATIEIALHEIKNTIIDFCEKSMVLQETLDPVTTIANISDYDLEPPTNRLVVKILRSWYKNNQLVPQSTDEINGPAIYNADAADAHVEYSAPRIIMQKDPRTYSLYPIPKETVTNSVTLRVALKPTRSVDTIDDVIYEEYADTIGRGAVARLAISPNKPYTSDKVAMASEALYRAGLNVARDRALKSFVRVAKQVHIRRI